MKKRSLAAFSSQFDDQITDSKTALSNGRFIANLEATAKTAGAMIGADFGEAYCADGPIPMQGLPNILGHSVGNYSAFL